MGYKRYYGKRKITTIGNAKGVTLPPEVVERFNTDYIDMMVTADRVIIIPHNPQLESAFELLNSKTKLWTIYNDQPEDPT